MEYVQFRYKLVSINLSNGKFYKLAQIINVVTFKCRYTFHYKILDKLKHKATLYGLK